MDNRQIERITSCRACGHANPETVFDLGPQPFANGLLDRPDQPELVCPLELLWCPACHLVQLGHTADPSELFSNYIWVTGTSSSTLAYAEQFCLRAMTRIGDDIRRSYVLEVASNDGSFLKPFQTQGVRVLGVDAAANIVDIAERAGIPTRAGFFGEALAREIVAEHGPAALVLARNVLPHVADLHDFIRGLSLALATGGRLLLEVHYGKVIVEGLHYDSIYHEHLCYFTLGSLGALLKTHGLAIVGIDESPISGGSLVLTVVREGTLSPSPAIREWVEQEQDQQINERETWRRFAKRSGTHADALRAALETERAGGRVVAGYGASARSSTMINVAGLGPLLSTIADQNEMKQGKYSPGAHVRICSPKELMQSAPDTVVVFAWNFFEEIQSVLRRGLDFAGRIVKPLPDVTTCS